MGALNENKPSALGIKISIWPSCTVISSAFGGRVIPNKMAATLVHDNHNEGRE